MAGTDRFFYLYLALLLLLLPLPWVLAAVLAAAFHEGCHMTALFFSGGELLQFRAGFRGMTMTVGELSIFQELLCAAAGPAGSFLLLLLYRWFPEIALCGAVQGLYNLLPLYPYDGGRILRCLGNLLFPGQAEAVCRILENLVCLILALSAGWILVYLSFNGLIPALAMVFPVLRKIPCKQAKIRVQ